MRYAAKTSDWTPRSRMCARPGILWGAKKSPGYVYVSRSNWRFLKRTLAKGLATTRSLGTKHGTRTREEEYVPPAKGYLFEARAGATTPHLNYMAVYHKIKELAPDFLILW